MSGEERIRPAVLTWGALTLGALALYTATWLLSANAAAISPSVMGVYYDGYLYVEIAKSFPLPFSADGPHYLGQAPAFPAVMYLGRVLSGFTLDWGLLAMLATVIPAALCTPVFWAVCRELELPPFWPTLLFVCANPRWITNAATIHTEPLAALFALLCLLAYLRGQLFTSVLWLSIAGLTRFPTFLLGVPLAFGWLVVRRDVTLRTFAGLAIPPAAFALYNLYLYSTIPTFQGLGEAHSIFWATHFTWPFASWLTPIPWNSPHFFITYVTLAVYLGALVVSVARPARQSSVLALWIAAIVGFHVSLAGELGVGAFTRFALLVWPAALLALWAAVGERIPVAARVALCTVSVLYAVQFQVGHMPTVVERQNRVHPFLHSVIARIDMDDEPRWIDFRKLQAFRFANPDWFRP